MAWWWPKFGQKLVACDYRLFRSSSTRSSNFSMHKTDWCWQTALGNRASGYCWRGKISAVCLFTLVVTIHTLLFRKYKTSTPCVSYFVLHCNWISLGRCGSSPDLESGWRWATRNMWIAGASTRCILSCWNRQHAGCTHARTHAHTRLNRKRLRVPSVPAEVLISKDDMSDGECDTIRWWMWHHQVVNVIPSGGECDTSGGECDISGGECDISGGECDTIRWWMWYHQVVNVIPSDCECDTIRWWMWYRSLHVDTCNLQAGQAPISIHCVNLARMTQLTVDPYKRICLVLPVLWNSQFFPYFS
jgi:hypothetical protein